MEYDLITVVGLLSMGGLGALFRTILKENSLTLPTIKEGKLILGFLGSIIIGAAVGLLVDHSLLTAFFAGYTGFSAIAHLLPDKTDNTK